MEALRLCCRELAMLGVHQPTTVWAASTSSSSASTTRTNASKRTVNGNVSKRTIKGNPPRRVGNKKVVKQEEEQESSDAGYAVSVMALEPREEYLSLNSLPRLKDLKKKPAHIEVLCGPHCHKSRNTCNNSVPKNVYFSQEFAEETSLGLTEIDEDDDTIVTEIEEDSIMDIYENSQDIEEVKETPTSRQFKGIDSDLCDFEP